jgi:PIN domain nuclease of toxin-antitoxin system
MDLLLDTHAFIWWAGVDKRLAEVVRAAIADAENRVVVSAVTIWEISIKRAIGKLESRRDTLRVLEQTGFKPLDITARHADLAGSLPLHHVDPDPETPGRSPRGRPARSAAEPLLGVT